VAAPSDQAEAPAAASPAKGGKGAPAKGGAGAGPAPELVPSRVHTQRAWRACRLHGRLAAAAPPRAARARPPRAAPAPAGARGVGALCRVYRHAACELACLLTVACNMSRVSSCIVSTMVAWTRPTTVRSPSPYLAHTGSGPRSQRAAHHARARRQA
jgi:hypothetical protein